MVEGCRRVTLPFITAWFHWLKRETSVVNNYNKLVIYYYFIHHFPNPLVTMFNKLSKQHSTPNGSVTE